MEDLKSEDPKTREAAETKVQELMNELKERNPEGRGSAGQKEEILQADPKNQRKTVQLQLEKFEKNKDNEALLKKIGYTKEEYQRFLDGMRNRVENLQDEVAQPEDPAARDENRKAATTVKVGGAGKRDNREGGVTDNGGTGGGVAPKGFSDAKQKFAAEVSKLRQQKKEK